MGRYLDADDLATEAANKKHGECSCTGSGRHQAFDCEWHHCYYDTLDLIQAQREEVNHCAEEDDWPVEADGLLD